MQQKLAKMILYLVNNQLSSVRYRSKIRHYLFLSNVYNLLGEQSGKYRKLGEKRKVIDKSSISWMRLEISLFLWATTHY